MSEANQLGGLLKSLRVQRNLSLRAAAASGQISHGYLAQLESGEKGTPSQTVLLNLAKAYAVAPELLYRAAELNDEGMGDTSAERLRWAFRCVCLDPDFAAEFSLEAWAVPVSVQGLLVRIYEQTTGRRLLTASEQQSTGDALRAELDQGLRVAEECRRLEKEAFDHLLMQAQLTAETRPRDATRLAREVVGLLLAVTAPRFRVAVAHNLSPSRTPPGMSDGAGTPTLLRLLHALAEVDGVGLDKKNVDLLSSWLMTPDENDASVVRGRIEGLHEVVRLLWGSPAG